MANPVGKRRQNLPLRTACMMMRVGFRPVRCAVGRLALIRKLPLESWERRHHSAGPSRHIVMANGSG